MRLNSATPLSLNNPEMFWFIESGLVHLFAIPIHKNKPGTRHYLFSSQAGEAIFGMAQIELEGQPRQTKAKTVLSYQVIAVATPETILHPLTLPNIDTSSPSVHLPSLLTTWTQKLTAVCPQLPTPATFLDESTLATELNTLHQNFLHLYHQQQQQNQASQFRQLAARDTLNRQVILEAMGKLHSVLNPQPQSIPAADTTPLLIAAGAVGRAMGITIRPPSHSEPGIRLKDPLEAIARASRIRTRRLILPDGWWRYDSGPLLGYTNDHQPVALLPLAAKGYELYTPTDNHRTRINSRTAKQLSAHAYTFYRPLPDKPLNAFDMIQFALQKRRKDLGLIMLTGIFASLLGMLTPQGMAILIDNAIPNTNQQLLIQITLALLGAAFGVALFELTQGFASLRLRSFSGAATQAAVWDRLFNLNVSFFRHYTTGDLKSRVSAINEIRQQLSVTILGTFLRSFFALLNLGLLFLYSFPLALIALAVGLVALIFTTVSGILTLPNQRQLAYLRGELFGLGVQLIGGVAKLRVAAAENRAFAYWSQQYCQQLQLMLRTQNIENRVLLFNTLLPLISAISLFPLVIFYLQQGETDLSIGTFLAFNAALGIFITGISRLSTTLIELLYIRILWERVQPILQEPPEVDLNKVDPGRLTGQLKLDRVSFRYRPDSPLILDQVTLAAKPGEFIALVGPSGSGKSTLIRLLLGFEIPEQGTVYYDDRDLLELDMTAVRRQLGVVLQNGKINTQSIFENIACGALISHDEAWDAARMAGFAEDIQSFPMGMHTVISEGGSNLSGGQRQRLLIARALVLKPKILIFDEATSALDNRTQAIVTESLDQLRVTRVVVAHRLSTIRHSDRIYVLEAGKIVQQGTFKALMNQDGLFSRLMARQLV